MSRFNVLVLHRMGDPRYRREAVRSLEFMIPECRPDLNCIVHDTDLPFPDYLKDIDYHLIVLGPTFLCNRYHPRSFINAKREYAFISDSHACKIALPQDDYDCSGLLDDWMVEWKISCVYTVCPEHWEILYPRASRTLEIRLGYTGYISDEWIDSWRYTRKREDRTIDVSYRASKLPANFGKMGQLKWEIAERFRSALTGRAKLNLDISVDPRDFIPGDKWHRFLENSKFCLATPSGSSLLDPHNNVRRCVNELTALKPKSTFEDIAATCFSGHDGKHLFLAISPRNLEAALAETVQIATQGSYSGLMFPGQDYILLQEDCENIEEVLRMMSDSSLVTRISKRCKESVLSEARLRRINIVNEIISFTESYISQKNVITANQDKTDKLFALYRIQMESIARLHWNRKRLLLDLKSVALRLGFRRVGDLYLSLFR